MMVDMTALLGSIHGIVVERMGYSDDLHHEICSRITSMYDLWEDDKFPIWLSRVVEGEIQDYFKGR